MNPYLSLRICKPLASCEYFEAKSVATPTAAALAHWLATRPVTAVTALPAPNAVPTTAALGAAKTIAPPNVPK